MTALLILTLITGQTLEVEAPLAGCKAAVEQFNAGAPGYAEINGARVKILTMHCEVKT